VKPGQGGKTDRHHGGSSDGTGREDAVSELIGAIVLTAVIVAGVTIVGVVLWSQPPPLKIPSLSAVISNQSCTIGIYHNGGDVLDRQAFRIFVDGANQTANFQKKGDAGTWTRWVNGDTLEYAPATCTQTPKRVDIIYSDGTIASVITTAYFGAYQPPGLTPGPTPAPTPTPSPPWYCGWNYRKNITIDKSKVPSDQTNFPVLISLGSDADLAARARSDGYDILFTASDGTTKLKHEIESYTSGSGALVAWVKIPSVSSSANTTILMYYGNAAAADQQDKNNVWDTGFKGVWHLNQGTGVTAVDSTSNANSATPVDNPATSTGQIGGALTFSYPDRLTIPAAASLDLTTYSYWTMSAWVKPTSYTSLQWPIIYSYGSYRASMGLTVREAGSDGRIENWINDATLRQSTNPVTLNAWNYVTITRTATTTSFYLNGNADGSSGVTTVTTAGQPSGIGSDPNGAFDLTEQYLGLIDEVRLSASSTSSGARSGDWIVTEYRNQNSPATFYYLGNQEQWTC